VIAAGALGSTELLLKCNDRGSLKLSNILGQKFFTNGDILGFMTLEHRTIDVTRGPINTSCISFKTRDMEYAYTIEDTTISKMVAPVFATMFELFAHGAKDANVDYLKDFIDDINLLLRFGLLSILTDTMSTTTMLRLFTTLWNNPAIRAVLIDILKTGTAGDESTHNFVEGLLSWAVEDRADPYASPEERMSRFYAFSGMGRGEKPGILKLKPNWKDLEDNGDPGEKIFVEWSAADNSPVLMEIVEGMKKLAGEIDAGGSTRVYTPTWNFDDPSQSTALILHPLGGCPMGDNIENGVVNSYGQVFWNDGSPDKIKVYPDLFVLDGSVLPEPPGVNPTMAIAAIAFRSAEKIVGSEYLPKA
jgi:hypothetical protein